ncbi:hypothetical protein AT15_05215 [Kosmotoga arenicorallina S304]|uniref:DUF4129 domain-containing protein n=1 Tax=Kosmotoga arenicorallina S304 TaxID=1453497 RepID=A0A176JUY2_9BACT|nr:hypothetical protein [Kosmotoga arenicorallina]OAA27221.1 hypothetical protein AT15_05215 [Kosmotoga arenicorallina S304]
MKKLSDSVSFLYASLAVIYVSARDFSLIGTSIILAVVLFMIYATRIRDGCSSFIMLPFLLFFSIFVSMATRQLDFGSSLYFFVVYSAILLSLSMEIRTAVIGIVLFGVSLSFGGFSGADAVFFAIIVLLWLFTRSLRVPVLSLISFSLITAIILLSSNGLELNTASSLLDIKITTAETPYATELKENAPIEIPSNKLIDLNPSASNIDEALSDKSLFIPDFLLIFLLIFGAISMLYMIIRVKAFSGFSKILILGIVIFTLVIASFSSIFLLLNQTENKPTALGTGIGPQFSGKASDGISGVISEIASSTGSASTDNGFFAQSIEWMLLIAASGIVIFMTFALIKLMKKVAVETSEEKEEKIPEEIELLPLDRFPDLHISKEYILAAYWWLRRKFFPGLHNLTPYELLTLEKGEATFKELTEIYVKTKYAGKSPSRIECERFYQLLATLSKRYKSPDEFNAYNRE